MELGLIQSCGVSSLAGAQEIMKMRHSLLTTALVVVGRAREGSDRTAVIVSVHSGTQCDVVVPCRICPLVRVQTSDEQG